MKFLNWSLLSCKLATEMIEKKNVVPLTFKEKLKLKLHMSVCEACKSYQKQSELIDLYFEHNKDTDEEVTPIIKNNELKSTVITKINNRE